MPLALKNKPFLIKSDQSNSLIEESKIGLVFSRAPVDYSSGYFQYCNVSSGARINLMYLRIQMSRKIQSVPVYKRIAMNSILCFPHEGTRAIICEAIENRIPHIPSLYRTYKHLKLPSTVFIDYILIRWYGPIFNFTADGMVERFTISVFLVEGNSRSFASSSSEVGARYMSRKKICQKFASLSLTRAGPRNCGFNFALDYSSWAWRIWVA